MANIVILHANQNNLEHICNLFSISYDFFIIDVAFNQIKNIDKNCIKLGSHIQVIQLNNNKISKIHQKAFSGLEKLRILDLSDNLILFIPKIMSLNSITNLLLIIHSNKIDPSSYAELSIWPFKFVQIYDYHLCCIFQSNVKCTTQKPWYTSCFGILMKKGVQICIFIISFAVFSSSILSFLVHLKLVLKKSTLKSSLHWAF